VTAQDLAARGLRATSDPYMAARIEPQQTWLDLVAAWLLRRLLALAPVADPQSDDSEDRS